MRSGDAAKTPRFLVCWDGCRTCSAIKEAIAASFVVFGGGGANEATAAALVFAALAADPQLRSLLRADPEQTRAFVDEVLRLEPPSSPWIRRSTTREVTIGDVTIPAGAEVKLHTACVNREDSGDDITIADGRIVRRRHWTFGAGPHRCPAANLARLELTVLINAWLARIPDFGVAGCPPIPQHRRLAPHQLTDERLSLIPPEAAALQRLLLRWDTADTGIYSAAHQAFERAAL